MTLTFTRLVRVSRLGGVVGRMRKVGGLNPGPVGSSQRLKN